MNSEEKTVNQLEEAPAPAKRRTSLRTLFLDLSHGILYAVISALLSLCTLPFGVAPLGLALLCAADRKLPYIAFGVCASALAFSPRPALFISAYAAVILIRILSRILLDPPTYTERQKTGRGFFGTLFSESFLLRMATAAVGAFIIGLYPLMANGFLFYDLYAAILGIVVAPVAVFIFFGIFNNADIRSGLYYTAAALIAAGAVFGARGLSIYGISLSPFLAMTATLFATRKEGVLTGVITGLITGLAYSPLYSPVFIFSALMFGALRRVSAIFAGIAAFFAGISWGIYVGGIGSISSLMSALLASALIFAVTDKLFLKDRKIEEKEEGAEAAAEKDIPHPALCPEKLTELRLFDIEREMTSLQSAFSELSGLFFEIGERMKKPLAKDIRQICDNAFDACCTNCKNRDVCWEESHTELISAINSMSALIHQNEKLSAKNTPTYLLQNCERISDIQDEIEHNTARHIRELLLYDKSEIFALDYEATSELIGLSVKKDSREYSPDTPLAEAVARELEALGIDGLSVAACGEHKKKILLSLPSEEVWEQSADKIKKSLSKLLGKEVTLEREQKLNGECRYLFTEAPLYEVEFAKASVMSEGESAYCGDTMNVFSVEGDRFFSMISDGMGSGVDAALTSRISAVFMEKMLTAGNSTEISLKMLNGFLRNKGGGSLHECSATMDLLELDLMRGEAYFHKSGAAPTYVFRRGELFKLRSKTLPLGIIKDVDFKKLKVDLQDGDVIIMISDGVTQGREDCPWLYETLQKTLDAEGIKSAVDLILERARRESAADDISVIAIRIVRK